MGFGEERYWAWVDTHMQRLGAHWTRGTMQFFWDRIEPKLDGPLNWDPEPFRTDSVITRCFGPDRHVNWLGVFHEGVVLPPPRNRPPLRHFRRDPKRYARFVRRVVERYDGDGEGDVSPYVKVKYWQLGNEIFTGDVGLRHSYVEFARITGRAIRQADPEAKIVLMSPVLGELEQSCHARAMQNYHWLENVVLSLKDSGIVDVLDVHYFSSAAEYKMYEAGKLRRFLDTQGLSDTQIWSCENATWAYKPGDLGPRVVHPYQSEKTQAAGLIKRFVYNFGEGVDKIFWAPLLDFENFGGILNSTGLIGDGAGNGEPPDSLGRPRASYYAYCLLSNTIDTDKARYAGKLSIHKEPELYAYEYTSLKESGVRFCILWRDQGRFSVVLPGKCTRAQVMNMVPDSEGRFEKSRVIAADENGKLSVAVGTAPLLVKIGG